MSNKNRLKSLICILFSFLFLFSSVSLIGAHADGHCDVKISVDKSTYSFRDTINLSVKVTNSYSEELKNVKVIIESHDLGFSTDRNSETNLETINSKQYGHADYSLIVSRNFSGLNFFQKIILFFVYLFNQYYEIPKADISGKEFVRQTASVSINGSNAEVVVYVLFTAPKQSVVTSNSDEYPSGPSIIPSNPTDSTDPSDPTNTINPTNPELFKLTYNANGGAGAPESQTGKSLTEICDDYPEKSGFVFVGWAKSADATYPDYFTDDEIYLTADITLYAVWKDRNIVYITPTGEKYHYLNPCGNGTYIETTLQEAESEGYLPCEKCVLSHVNNQPDPATVDTYRLSYSANGGTGAPSSQTGSNSYLVSSTQPTRSGYKFKGWSLSQSATYPSYYAGNNITLTSDTTLYAVWEKQSSSESQKTVYRTETGSKYHYSNTCGNGYYYPCTLAEALADGLTPCSKCVH